MSSRKIRHGGQMRKASEIISRTKKYKYNSSGSLVEITGAVTLGDNEFAVNGSKSSLRRIADLERNVTLLINKFTTDGETDSDTDFDDKVNNSILFKKDVKLGNSSSDEIDVAGHLDIQNGLTLGSTAQGVINALIDTKITAYNTDIVDAAPSTLNTLNELAAALGDDANFSTTVTNSIATKLSLTGGTMSGNINMGGNDITNAGTFNGVATTAKYADLAEKYAADADYEAGTVMMFGGDKEVTAAKGYGAPKIAGVVSTNPAYLMNGDAEGVAIALQGRVPCKVEGTVKKGDILVASDVEGHAAVWMGEDDPKMTAYIGIALADGEGMVEVKVGK